MKYTDDLVHTEQIEDKKVFYAWKKDKVGIIDANNSAYNIPIKYDEIKYDEGYDIYDVDSNAIAYVRSDNKWGAYCYLVDYHERYDEKTGKLWEQEYVKKRFIAPLFDSIKVLKNDCDPLYLLVSLNGKYGILEAYSRRFVTPIVFDSIDKTIITYMNFEVFGQINGKNIRYDGKHFYEQTPYYFNYSDEYRLVKKKIEKREDK